MKEDKSTCTLDPIRTAGPAALDTHGQPGLKKVTLRELHITWENEQHDTVILISDDILAHPNGTTYALESIFGHADLTSATLDFQYEDWHHPHWAKFCPPSSINLQYPSDANRIFAWMDLSHFRLPAKLANAVTILLLALASAMAPANNDGDDDEDDVSSDHWSLCA